MTEFIKLLRGSVGATEIRAHRIVVIAAVGLLSVVASLTLVASLTWPLGWDQGVYAWVGDTILRGGLPYRDAIDWKGPLTYLPFAATQAIFGRHAWPIRAFDGIALMATLWVLWASLGRVADRRSAWFGVALGAVWYFNTGFWSTAQPDGWASMAIAATVYSLVGTTTAMSRRRAYLTGALVATAVLFKLPYLIFVPIPVAAVLLDSGLSVRSRFWLVAVGASGFITCFVLVVGWFS